VENWAFVYDRPKIIVDLSLAFFDIMYYRKSNPKGGSL